MPTKEGPRLVYRVSSFTHPRSNLTAFIDAHPLNVAMYIVLPTGDGSGSADLPPPPSLSTPAFYYRVTGDIR